MLDSLLAEFAKPDNAGMITELNLDELIADLTAAEAHFNELYLESANIEASKEAFVAASTLKKEVLALQIQIVNYLNARQEAEPDKYGKVSKKTAELISTLNQKIRNRKARQERKNKKQ